MAGATTAGGKMVFTAVAVLHAVAGDTDSVCSCSYSTAARGAVFAAAGSAKFTAAGGAVFAAAGGANLQLRVTQYLQPQLLRTIQSEDAQSHTLYTTTSTRGVADQTRCDCHSMHDTDTSLNTIVTNSTVYKLRVQTRDR